MNSKNSTCVFLAFLMGCSGQTEDSAVVIPTEPVVGTSPAFEGDSPTNIVMISIDTLRKDHLSRFDPEKRNLTPYLNDLMNQGWVSDNYRTCSNWTYHGVSCTVGGRMPVEAGFLPRLVTEEIPKWEEGTPFLASWLADAGYYNVLASANGWFAPGMNNAAGYAGFYGVPFMPAADLFELGRDDLVAALDGGHSGPWMLHLHVLEPHAPYAPPEEYLDGLDALPPIEYDLTNKGAHYNAVFDDWSTLSPDEQELILQHMHLRYEGEIRHLDDLIKVMLADLDGRGLLDDALVVFWNDHGEQFFERGHQSHAWNLGVEENDGFVLLWSKNIVADASNAPASAIDVAPTLLTIMGLQMPEEVTGLMLGDAPADRERRAAANARAGVVQSITVGQRQLNFNWSGVARYYHLDSDPTQQNDVFDAKDPEVEELWDRLLPYIEQADAVTENATPKAPPGLNLSR